MEVQRRRLSARFGEGRRLVTHAMTARRSGDLALMTRNALHYARQGGR